MHHPNAPRTTPLEVLTPTTALLDGRYVLEDRIGQGGMAAVYRAEDTHLGRTVAIKMIHDRDGELGSAERAHTEKALLAGLNHPSLVTLFDAQLEPNRPQYLVMELVDGPTLADLIADGPIPPQRLARITRGLAQGLAAAHAAGIVHRDVKPSNILMAPPLDGADAHTAKLADFGIAYSLTASRTTSPGVVLGTLMYMAPEQLRNEETGTAVDIFALGLVALEALTGAPAYPPAGAGFQPLLTRVSHPSTIPDSVDDRWRDLLERMLRLEPTERPSAVEVARAARGLGGTREMDASSSRHVAPATGIRPEREAPTDPRTAPTAVMAPASTSRTRRRAILGVASLGAVAALAAGAAMLSPADLDAGRSTLVTSLRGASEPASTPEATESEPSAPVETVNDPTEQENQGTQDDPGNSNPGSGNPGNGNPGNQGSRGEGNQGQEDDNRGNSGQSKGKDD